MTLQQLRYLREVARHGLNISDAARALSTSQPGISKQLRLLEEELEVEIFSRKHGRIVELTYSGMRILSIAEKVLRDTDALKKIGNDFSAANSRSLLKTSLPFLSRDSTKDSCETIGNAPDEICFIFAGSFPTTMSYDRRCFPLFA